jgi:hypothetical protein
MSLVRVLRVQVPDTILSFIWSISNITLARLILNLRRLSSDAGDNSEEEVEDDGDDGVEQTELPVLRRGCSGSRRSDSEPHKIL